MFLPRLFARAERPRGADGWEDGLEMVGAFKGQAGPPCPLTWVGRDCNDVTGLQAVVQTGMEGAESAECRRLLLGGRLGLGIWGGWDPPGRPGHRCGSYQASPRFLV